MSILTVSRLAKSYGADTLFSDIAFTLAAGQKMGLVGRNGGGKTTLLRILLGQEHPDPNPNAPPKVTLAAGRRMGYLRQEAPVHPEHTLAREIEDALAPLRALQARVADAERAMGDAADDDALAQAMEDYDAARDAFEAHGGYAVEEERDTVLRRLGFDPDALGKRVGDCSGGEQTRLALAKLVLTRPDLLILDEPTNHLDIAAVEWLEGFLREYPGAVLLVSHDRAFLDAVTDTIAELELGALTVTKGNYSHFRRQKDERLQRQQEMYDQQQAEINRLKGIIARNMGADALSSSMRHKTQGRIDRMEKIEAPRTDTRQVKARIDAAGAGRIGREAIRIQGLAMAYGARTLFRDVDAVIERGDRVGLVGPNGAGKTTLVRLLLGEETPSAGTIALGHNVRRAYFSQHATDDLDVAQTVYDTIAETVPGWTETQVRNTLGRFLFTGDDIRKRVGMLSGGEKNKLALARMLLAPVNLLILDEPTNHLDIESCDTLARMLQEYQGTLLLVSHDRYLLNAVTTKTLGLTGDGRARLIEGNYAVWRETCDQERAAKTPVAAAAAPKAPALSHRETGKARQRARAATEKAEAAVHDAEAALARVESALSSGDPDADLVALAAEHGRLRAAVDAAVAAWERAAADEEALG